MYNEYIISQTIDQINQPNHYIQVLVVDERVPAQNRDIALAADLHASRIWQQSLLRRPSSALRLGSAGFYGLATISVG